MLLTNIDIKRYISELYKQTLTDKGIDFERGKVIRQDKNLIAKNMAIAQYDKIMERVTDKIEGKLEIVWGGEQPEKLSTKKKK